MRETKVANIRKVESFLKFIGSIIPLAELIQRIGVFSKKACL